MDFYVYPLNDTLNIAYLSVAKCGSCNIRDKLNKLTGAQIRYQFNVKTLEDLTCLPPNTVTFSIVRNPWARMHSTFNMANKTTSLDLPALFERFVADPDTSDALLIPPGHWTPQWDQLISEDGHFVPDYIGKLESFTADLKQVLTIATDSDKPLQEHMVAKLDRILTEEAPVHHLNADLSNLNSYYIKYYNDHTRDLVGEYSKHDVSFFDYNFNIAEPPPCA